MSVKNVIKGIVISSVLLLTGCASVSSSPERNVQLDTIYKIENNTCINGNLQFTEDIESYLDEQNLYESDKLDGYRWVACKGLENGWKYSICTMDNEKFIYRNMEYQIPIYEGDDYILYQLPGESKDYMIFVYSNKEGL